MEELNDIKNEYPNIIKEVRGIGLLIGLQLHEDQNTSDDDTTCEVPRKNTPEAAKKTRRKKPVTRKPAAKKSAARKSTPRKSTTRRTRKKAVDKKDTPEDKGDEKKAATSYFKTWKGPYDAPD